LRARDGAEAENQEWEGAAHGWGDSTAAAIGANFWPARDPIARTVAAT
jgi:hypothetical protein